MEHSKRAEAIEQLICNHVGVDVDEMLTHTKKGACVKAKHLSIYILHNMYHISLSWLASRYGFSVRHIVAVSASVRDYVRYNNEYREWFYEIEELVNNLPSDDIIGDADSDVGR